MEIVSYEDAARFLDGRDERKVPSIKATKIRKRVGPEISLCYHDTPVVTWFANENIRLHTGGYQTQTTKRRINRFTPIYIRVSQKDCEWFVSIPYREEPVPFAEGMIITPNGQFTQGE